MPAYATTPNSETARLSLTSGCFRASSMIKGCPEVTACWQKECDSGVWRRDRHGSGSPTQLLKNCRSASTRDTSATGQRSRRAASLVRRSKFSSGGESSAPVARSAPSREAPSSTLPPGSLTPIEAPHNPFYLYLYCRPYVGVSAASPDAAHDRSRSIQRPLIRRLGSTNYLEVPPRPQRHACRLLPGTERTGGPCDRIPDVVTVASLCGTAAPSMEAVL